MESSSATTALWMTCSFGSVVKRGPSRSSEDVSPLRASKTCALAILITHLPDPDDGVLAARHTAADPELVVLRVDGDDLDVTHRGRLVAHLARHLLSLEDPGRVGRRPDGAWLPYVVRAVAHRAPGETVALDGSLETLAFGRGADMNPVAHLEDIHADALANLAAHVPQLLQVFARRRIELGERASAGPVDPAGLGCPEADLYRRIAILLGGADRRDQVRLHLDYGYAEERAVILEGLGHLLLAPEYRGCHNPTSPLSLCSRRRAGRAAAASRPCAASAAGCL